MKSQFIIFLCGEQGVKQARSDAYRYNQKVLKDLPEAERLFYWFKDNLLNSAGIDMQNDLDIARFYKQNPNIYDLLDQYLVEVRLLYPTYLIEITNGWTPPADSPWAMQHCNSHNKTTLSDFRICINTMAQYSKIKCALVGTRVTEQNQFAIFIAMEKEMLVEGVRGFGAEDVEPDYAKLVKLFNCPKQQDALREIWNSSRGGAEVALAMEEILKIPLYIPNYDAYTLETDFPYHKIYIPKPETLEKFSFSCSVTVPKTREFDWTSNIAVLHFLKDGTDGALLEHLVADCREKHDYATIVEEEKYISWWNSNCITDNVYDYAAKLTEKYHCKAFAVNAYDGLFISLGAFQNGQLITEAAWGEGRRAPNMAVLQEAFGVGPELAKVFRLRSLEKVAKQLPEAMQFYVDISQSEMTICVQNEDCLVMKSTI